jgi:ubiquinone/menaquinone biosynthesis C-methylase UbiE
MLAVVQVWVPCGDLEGDLRHLLGPDQHIDLAVCVLILLHLLNVAQVFGEFARVLLASGWHAAISQLCRADRTV